MFFEKRDVFENYCSSRTLNIPSKTTEQHFKSLKDDGVVCNVLGKYAMCFPNWDQNMRYHMEREGFWEAWVSMCLMHHIKPGMTCLDIGASWGYYTLLMADLVGWNGKIISYEPNPLVIPYLKNTVKLNSLTNRVFIYESAVYSSNEPLELYFNKYDTMVGKIIPSPDPMSVSVKSTTIDDIFNKAGMIDFIKIDAEGGELPIFNGMKNIIKENPHIKICMEFEKNRYPDPELFLNKIQNNFDIHMIDDSGKLIKALPRSILLTPDWTMLFLTK